MAVSYSSRRTYQTSIVLVRRLDASEELAAGHGPLEYPSVCGKLKVGNDKREMSFIVDRKGEKGTS